MASGGVAWFYGAKQTVDILWATGTLVALLPASWWVIAALRRGRFGVDVIAVLSLLGTLAVGEYLAGSLIGVVLATGQAVERAPKEARRRVLDDVVTVPLEEVAVDDILVVGPGEMLPIDARIASSWAVLDESALTGESFALRNEGAREKRAERAAPEVVQIGAQLTDDAVGPGWKGFATPSRQPSLRVTFGPVGEANWLQSGENPTPSVGTDRRRASALFRPETRCRTR